MKALHHNEVKMPPEKALKWQITHVNNKEQWQLVDVNKKEIERRPRDAKTGLPLEPKAQPGYYPGYDTLSQQKFWDETTRNLVLNRVYNVPEIRFFTPDEVPILQAILDRVLPQDDRIPERRIPILHYIDQRMHEKKFDGYIYEGMPEEDEAHRLGIAAINEMARELYGKTFPELEMCQQEDILDSVRQGKPQAAKHLWTRLQPKHYFKLLVQDAAAAYYAHPWAWDEIGFGGPAYPRGYMRLSSGLPEPWEVDEVRYDWVEPEKILSHRFFEPEDVTEGGYPGMGGTH
jgi:hypothetical protein